LRLYRVLYYLDGAAPTEKGGVLYVPPQTGLGRINNPDDYEALYVGGSPAGVCAEVFYRGKFRSQWTDAMLAPLPNGSRRVLAWYEFPDSMAICDLNDPKELLARKLRPSDIATRDYTVTRQWALNIFREKRYIGVSWWSYCDALWATYGLWDRDAINKYGFEELTLAHAAMIEAASVMDVAIGPAPV
jgi:hypothetical protein